MGQIVGGVQTFNRHYEISYRPIAAINTVRLNYFACKFYAFRVMLYVKLTFVELQTKFFQLRPYQWNASK